MSMRSLPNALIIILVIWLIFVLIIPQIGDTMDPDNQIPGGFFPEHAYSQTPRKKAIMAKIWHI